MRVCRCRLLEIVAGFTMVLLPNALNRLRQVVFCEDWEDEETGATKCACGPPVPADGSKSDLLRGAYELHVRVATKTYGASKGVCFYHIFWRTSGAVGVQEFIQDVGCWGGLVFRLGDWRLMSAVVKEPVSLRDACCRSRAPNRSPYLHPIPPPYADFGDLP